MIRRAGLIQKLRILRSFSCNVKCDSVVCAADVGRQHSCLLRSFNCIAIFQLSRLVRVCLANAKKAECLHTCFLTKPATCCFAALLRSLSAHFAVPFYTLSFGKLKEQDAFTSCSLVKPATCCFAVLLRPLCGLRCPV